MVTPAYAYAPRDKRHALVPGGGCVALLALAWLTAASLTA